MSDAHAPKGHVTIGCLLGGPTPHFVRTALEMVMYDRDIGRRHLHPRRPFIMSSGQTFVTNGRNETVRKFLAAEGDEASDWLLFMDDDQQYPQNLLELLIESADPVERRIVALPVWKFTGLDKDTGRTGVGRNLFDVNDDTHAFVEMNEADITPDVVTTVGGVGTGCMMIHRTALEQVAAFAEDNGLFAGTCWFRQTHHDPGPYVEGEDLHFCRLAWAAGVSVWVNTSITLSHQKMVLLTEAQPAGSMVL